jgi:hypothetical protein
MEKIAIIGGGWAGLSSALLLSEKNEIHLFESSPNLGGRARSFKHENYILDNGSHLLFSGYEFTFKIFKKIQLDINDLYPVTISQLLALHKKKYLLNKKNNFFLAINFLISQDYSKKEKLSIAKLLFFLVFENMQKFKVSAFEFLIKKNISEIIVRKIFEPICVSIFNTNLKNVDARTYIFVLKKIIYVVSPVFFIPKIDLSDLFPNIAAKIVLKNKGRIYTKKMIMAMDLHSNKFNLKSYANEEFKNYDRVIFACGLAQREKIKINNKIYAHRKFLKKFENVITIYFYFSETLLNLPPMFQLDHPSIIDWVINYEIIKKQRGFLSVVISESKKYAHLSNESVLKIVENELTNKLNLSMPRWSKILNEKNATLINHYEREKDSLEYFEKFHFVGDYTYKILPNTIESAIASSYKLFYKLEKTCDEK